MKIIISLILVLISFKNTQFTENKSNSDPEKALASFQILDGFQIELVASEPLIRDPVAMEIDEDGNWYVAEMPGYPLDLSKTGNIKKLKDTNGDGLPDKSIVFASGLTLPMGIMKWKKGILVADSPNIWYLEDTDGDEVADKKEVMLTGFSLSNPQHNMNTPKFGVDNWIYLGHSGAINSFAYEKVFSDKGSEIRFPNNPNTPKLSKNNDGKNVRFKPLTYELESLSGETQFGHTTDAWGHRFYTDNANHLFHEVMDARYIAQNPNLAIADAMQKIPDHGDACEVFPTTENPNHQLLTDVGIVTSSCGITYYDGGAFGENFENVTFVGEPVHNLVHADKIEQNGATFTGKRLIEKSEFLSSKDPWFRPVNFYVGPDGALYLIDYYRQIIEHPEWMSDEINNSGALYNGTEKGRIYRISKKGSGKMDWFGKTNISKKNPSELTEILKSTNGWDRRTAQRLIFQNNDPSVTGNLIKILAENNPKAKIPALWLLNDWQKITPDLLTNLLKDVNPGVRENALQVADRLINLPQFNGNLKLKNQINQMLDDKDPRVRFQLLCSSAFFNDFTEPNFKSAILTKNISDPWFGLAAISSSYKTEYLLLDQFTNPAISQKNTKPNIFISQLSATSAKSGDRKLFEKALLSNEPWESAVYTGMAELWDNSKAKFQLTEIEKTTLIKKFVKTKDIILQKSIVDLLATTGLPQDQIELDNVLKLLNKNNIIDNNLNTLKLLSLSSNEKYAQKITTLLLNNKEKSLQMAAYNALPKKIENSKIAKINKNYKNISPFSKKLWVTYLTERYDRVNILLTEIQSGNISQNDLEWHQKVGLMNYYDNRIRLRARKILSINEDRKAVLQQYLMATEMKGNAEIGQKIFEESCATCHKIKGVGVDFGPDLSTLKSRNIHSIITEIINPNNSIADKYGSWDIELKNGNKISGIITAENNNSIFIKTMGGKVQSINVSEVKSKEIAKLSAMPNGLENAINVQQTADLVAFIKNI